MYNNNNTSCTSCLHTVVQCIKGWKKLLVCYNSFCFFISGWWFVTNGKDQGWAPCSYLEGDKDEEEAMTSLGISLCYREDLKFTVYFLSPPFKKTHKSITLWTTTKQKRMTKFPSKEEQSLMSCRNPWMGGGW